MVVQNLENPIQWRNHFSSRENIVALDSGLPYGCKSYPFVEQRFFKAKKRVLFLTQD